MEKKEIGAAGRKRRRLEEEDTKRSSVVLKTFLGKMAKSDSSALDLPAPTTILCESKEGSGTSVTQPVMVAEFDTSHTVEITGEKDCGGACEVETVELADQVIMEGMEPLSRRQTEVAEVCEHQSVVPVVITERDIGLLKFKKDNGRAVQTDALRTEIVELGQKYFQNVGLIDKGLQSQMARERQKWREILKRIVNCIRYLVLQNLALRGHRESLLLNDDSSLGNFLELVRSHALFDPVLKEQLTNVERHPWCTSYLSPGVQNEIIHLMASNVRKSLLRGICRAKYYGLMFDSTPDEAHREQMAEVVRYVEIDYELGTVSIKEVFLGFIQIRQKDAASLAEHIFKQLEKDGLELQHCRAQCYDNAVVMAGHKNGVQQKISMKNSQAMFVNCNNHSLNLVGVHAAKHDKKLITFFGTVDALYTFFSRSTLRWEKLKSTIPVVLKSQSETRWSSRTEAVKPIHSHLDDLLYLLQDMADDENETKDTNSEAEQLYNSMLTFPFLTLLGFWDNVLNRIDSVQRRLQNPKTNFHEAAQDIKSLRDYFITQRELLVSNSLEQGISLCQEWDVEVETRRRGGKGMADENCKDAGLTAKEEMERVLKGAVNRIHTEMNERFTRLLETDDRFGFLLDVEELCYSNEIGDLEMKCENLAKHYTSDFAGNLLFDDITNVRMLLTNPDHQRVQTPEELLQFIVRCGDKGSFSALRIAIQIMLTVAISIASCKRSFSKLKLILSYLRASMGQEGLSDLALLSIEKEETMKTDSDEIIDQFAKTKKVPL